MDLSLIQTNKGNCIKVNSVHGMLWLQTHFEKESWESIASNEILVSQESSKMLSYDAAIAGIEINYVKDVSITRKFSKPH